ncbi:MAG: hypothetical protein ACLP1X_33060 [Polyangiaceae bacterium]
MATFSLLAGGALLFAGMTVAADAGAGVAARLAYARSGGASSCPDESALRSAVAGRVGYDPFFPWAKRTFVVQVWRDSGRYMARLQIIDEHGLTHGTRQLSSSGPDCTELFDTVALAISIAVDELPKDESPPPIASVPPSPTDPSSAPAPPPSPAPLPVPPPDSVEQPDAAGPGNESHIVAGIDAVASLDTAPTPTVGVSAAVGVRWRTASVSFELHADAPASAQSAAGIGRVTANSYAAAVVPCVHYGDGFVCAVGALGDLHAEGSAVSTPRSASTLVAAAGGRVGLEWPLSRKLSLLARFDLLVDLRRATFVLAGENAWTAPVFAGVVGAGFLTSFE